jgi:hypothetical protein
MSGDHLTTKTSPPATTAAIRADAVAYLERTGNADLAEVLGLADVAYLPVCPVCGKPLRAGNRLCRARDCLAGPAARGVKR